MKSELLMQQIFKRQEIDLEDCQVRVSISEVEDGDMRDPINKHSLFNRLDIDPGRVVEMQTNHDGRVVVVDNNSPDFVYDADALITTRDSAKILFVKTADCFPVVISSHTDGVYALIHAGWQELQKDVVSNTVRKVRELVAHPKDLKAFVGPGIDVESYEIQKDVARLDWPEGAVKKDGSGILKLDLFAVIKHQLIASEIRSWNIEKDGRSTYKDPSLFSHRRSTVTKDRASDGRIGILIGSY